MSEKIIIKRVENIFPEHKADELVNFNIAARNVFEEYLEDKDLTPKKRDLYSGKIILVDTKYEDNRYSLGAVILNVQDGVVQELCLATSNKDLRIEKNMACSNLYKRVIDMYFGGVGCWFDKVMYAR